MSIVRHFCHIFILYISVFEKGLAYSKLEVFGEMLSKL